jgi:transcription-repair coupling factor (superfamily II helicase)
VKTRAELPESIARLAEHCSRPRRTAAEVGNLWGSSPAYLVACLRRALEVPALVIVPTAAEAEATAEDLESFGSPAVLFPEIESPDQEAPFAAAQRMRALGQAAAGVVVATVRSAAQPIPPGEEGRLLRRGLTIQLKALVGALADGGLARVPRVEQPGDFAVRGGILDVFAMGDEAPVRVELDGDTIASVRAFDPETQASGAPLEEAWIPIWGPARLHALAFRTGGRTIADALPEAGLVALVGMAEAPKRQPVDQEQIAALRRTVAGRGGLWLSALPVPDAPQSVNLKIRSLQRFSGRLAGLPQEVAALAARGRVVIFCRTDGERRRLTELLGPGPEYRPGRIHRGFVFEETGEVFTSNHELFNRYLLRRSPVTSRAREAEPFLQIRDGDVVVHADHGIGVFRGFKRIARGGADQEYAAVEYAGGAVLYVPADELDRLQKYSGGTDRAAPLSHLGTQAWSEARARAQESARALAREMLRTQALRQLNLGTAFPPDTEWQAEFEASFPYEETPDQDETARTVKRELEAPRPMDRLLCGDVGYGKTEIAMRAAFKVATAGKQVAVLVPTTILAQQHGQTFRERMADYPIAIEVLSRFKSKAEQKQTLERLAAGAVDVVIGTHRLIQKDVLFRDLGLLIIDEEQRFGVEAKEFLKRMRATVDVLTLTATPIPRTLHLSLLGIKEISSLATPPRDRLSIRSEILLRDDRRIVEAIRAELDRGGQVFFVHNRVHSIRKVASRLEALLPEAVVAVGHGQMDEEELEQTMIDFLDRKVDVLVSTTIIESGLDIPNVNTILIDDADQLGLADLHQLRGRVGRTNRQAFAGFLMPTDRPVTPAGYQRLKAIEEYSELGAGFKLALRDLEIRGAGNILGREQSGHIAAVGYELYCQMLERAVRQVQGGAPEAPRVDCAVSLAVRALIPEEYVDDLTLRIETYRRIARARDAAEVDRVAGELRDRFGPPPPELEALLRWVRLKRAAEARGIASIAEGKEWVTLSLARPDDAEALRARSPRLMRRTDERTLKIPRDLLPPGGGILGALIELLSPT